EPSAILEIVEEVSRAHDVDRRRVFVAGLSAGASMAAILAEQAPDVFSAAALMAGVALHAASDEPSAYAAMRGQSAPDRALLGRGTFDGKAYAGSRAIVWTGALDRRVNPVNARILADQFRTLYGLPPEPAVQELSLDGSQSIWRDAAGRERVVLREVPALGHAWSGGSLRGSYTAPAGPKFSEAAFRFFLEG
ncbi:MAG: prolyl oligopeptidase family serine peptidase, partial [Candidatus Eremiobacteraeota bacterium]|nr:prolyl oligopeptidase family serine peptidase [Candidatus Eremiobacteraeota bacterium]